MTELQKRSSNCRQFNHSGSSGVRLLWSLSHSLIAFSNQPSHRTLQRLHYTATPCQDCIGLTFSSSVVDFNQLPRCETRHLAFRARARDIWRENTFRCEVVFLVSNYCALLLSRKWLRCFASERSSVNSPRIETHIIQFINS